MLHYAVVYLVIALIAAVLGFGGIAGDADEVAKLISFGFATLSALSLVIALLRKLQACAQPQQKRTPT